MRCPTFFSNFVPKSKDTVKILYPFIWGFFLTGCLQSTITKVIKIDRQAHPSAPFSAPLNHPHLLSAFGPRNDSYHTGADLRGQEKNADSVLAARNGTVVYTGWKGAYGNVVEIKHADGFISRYAHLKKSFVKAGEKIKQSQKIGLVGATGRASAPHLHFEILTSENRFTDPCQFIRCQ